MKTVTILGMFAFASKPVVVRPQTHVTSIEGDPGPLPPSQGVKAYKVENVKPLKNPTATRTRITYGPFKLKDVNVSSTIYPSASIIDHAS